MDARHTWHIKLRHHANAELGAVGDHILDILLGVEAGMDTSQGSCELRKSLRLNTETTHVRGVQVEHVQFVRSLSDRDVVKLKANTARTADGEGLGAPWYPSGF